jgi:DNA-binding CsgD family transcriptional regulator
MIVDVAFMLIEGRISRLLHTIYDASMTPDLWPGALRDLAELTKARMTSFIDHRPERDSVLAEFGLDPTFVSSYERHYYRHNIYLQKGRPILREGVVVPHEVYCSDQEILRSEYYNDFQRHLGLFRVLAGAISSEPNRHILLSVNRSRNQPEFSGEDVRLIEFLLPHLRRALEIGTRIRESERGNQGAPAPDILALKLGLTKAEATFAGLLTSGLSVGQICGRLRIRESTARTHLRHLYQKTDTRRQAELVSRLLGR